MAERQFRNWSIWPIIKQSTIARVEPETIDHVAIFPNSRGVHEDRYPPEGYRAWVVVSSKKERLLRLEVKKTQANDSFIEQLRGWLDSVDPVRPILTLE